jgi:ABC-type transport system substrate-binding protein
VFVIIAVIGPLVVADSTGQTFAQTFNPYVSTSLGTELNMQSLTCEPLLEFNILNPAQPPVPWPATSYAWSDGGRRLTFTIRPGVKFSDGTPMTASDVAFTFNLLMKNKALGSPAPAPAPAPLPASATAPDPSRDYTGWPTAANPYIDPVPNAPTWSTRCCTSPRPPPGDGPA